MVSVSIFAQSAVVEMDAATRSPREAFFYIVVASLLAFVVVVSGVWSVTQEVRRRGGYGVPAGSVVVGGVATLVALVGALITGVLAFDRVDTSLSLLDSAVSLIFVAALIAGVGLGIFASTRIAKARLS
ncbi:putative effector of murein hydrolase LrgA (UPF0299 family) [Rhodococcus sp. OAS809]|uniref:hypothetical protein n=1 Tax=Rhodococcus sp. OAS809 TaxID=2663874 RepID=UPI00178AE2CD